MGGVGPTNVLSFPARESDHDARGRLGSIVISVDAVLREAFLYHQPPRDHFIRLLTHAVLHLAGFEHGEIMEDMTEDIVARMSPMPCV